MGFMSVFCARNIHVISLIVIRKIRQYFSGNFMMMLLKYFLDNQKNEINDMIKLVSRYKLHSDEDG